MYFVLDKIICHTKELLAIMGESILSKLKYSPFSSQPYMPWLWQLLKSLLSLDDNFQQMQVYLDMYMAVLMLHKPTSRIWVAICPLSICPFAIKLYKVFDHFQAFKGPLIHVNITHINFLEKNIYCGLQEFSTKKISVVENDCGPHWWSSWALACAREKYCAHNNNTI